MKFTTVCQKSEPVAEFGVEINHENDPVMYVKFKGEMISLLYLDSSEGCRLCRLHIAPRHFPLLNEIGIDVVDGRIVLGN